MRELVERGDWDSLEEEWIEAISQEIIPLEMLMETTDLIAKGDRKRAVFLLSLFVEELIDRGDTSAAERVLQKGLDLAPSNRELRAHLEVLLNVQYGTQSYFRRFFDYAGFNDTIDPRKAWDAFRALLRIVPGNFVYHHGWSSGKITDIDIVSEEITVDFLEKRGHVMSWSMALQSLEYMPADHIRAYMLDRQDELKYMEPISLLGLAIRSGGCEADQKQLRALIEPVIPEGEWNSWWSKVRSQIETEPRIRPSLSRPVRYRWADDTAVGENDEKRREILSMNLSGLLRISSRIRAHDELRVLTISQIRKRLKPRPKDPLLFIDALLTLVELGESDVESEIKTLIMSSSDPVSLIMGLKSGDRKKRALALWDEIDTGDTDTRNVKMFFAAESSKDRQLVTDRMDDAEKHRLVWTVLRQLPEQASAFFWLVEQAQQGFPFPHPKLERLITLLQLLNDTPGIRTPVTAFLEGSGLVDETLREIKSEGAERLLEALENADISVSLKKELTDTIVTVFPELKEDGNFILTTAEGLHRREEELRHLVKIELPENKSAIGEAMAHGDLRENFEYKAAKEQQERILARISELQGELSRIRLIQPEAVNTDSVNFGVTVIIASKDGEYSELTILGPWDSDPSHQIFSYLAPGVEPLMGKCIHDTVELNLDRWQGVFTIIDIRAWQAP